MSASHIFLLCFLSRNERASERGLLLVNVLGSSTWTYMSNMNKGVSARVSQFVRRIASFCRRDDPKIPPTNRQRCKPAMGFWCKCPFCTQKVQCKHLTFLCTVEFFFFFFTYVFFVQTEKMWVLHSTALSTHKTDITHNSRKWTARISKLIPPTKWTGILPTNAAKRADTLKSQWGHASNKILWFNIIMMLFSLWPLPGIFGPKLFTWILEKSSAD